MHCMNILPLLPTNQRHYRGQFYSIPFYASCVTVTWLRKSSPPSATYMWQWIRSAMVQIWFVAYSAPSHYLKQCWIIVNWTLWKKLQWNFNQNTKLFIHENASESIVCKMAAILSIKRWVDQLLLPVKPHKHCLLSVWRHAPMLDFW